MWTLVEDANGRRFSVTYVCHDLIPKARSHILWYICTRGRDVAKSVNTTGTRPFRVCHIQSLPVIIGLYIQSSTIAFTSNGTDTLILQGLRAHTLLDVYLRAFSIQVVIGSFLVSSHCRLSICADSLTSCLVSTVDLSSYLSVARLATSVSSSCLRHGCFMAIFASSLLER